MRHMGDVMQAIVNLGDDTPSGDAAHQFGLEVEAELARIGTTLKEKNRAYGNSALEPVRVFSKADTVEQIKVRLDDKLSRLMRGTAAGEDVEHDLMGYLVLLRIARRREAIALLGGGDVAASTEWNAPAHDHQE
jgi:hypothetical protein